METNKNVMKSNVKDKKPTATSISTDLSVLKKKIYGMYPTYDINTIASLINGINELEHQVNEADNRIKNETGDMVIFRIIL